MPFMIRTADDRIAISTTSAEDAAKHVARLRAEGHAVLVTGHNGEQLQIDRLHELAKAHEVNPIRTSQSRA